jgi:N-acetylglucosamine-6-sulfatase
MVQTLRVGWAGRKRASTLSRRAKIMRRAYKHLVLFALVTLFAGLGMTASQTDTSLAQAATPPNILFIVTDDMNATDLDRVALDGRRVMPKTQSLLESQGVKFENAFVSRSLCCPSRSTILRGQYTHNHSVWVNVEPAGGFPRFRELGHESSTIATWLDSAPGFEDGYDTVLIGKYLNRYGNVTPTPHVAQGWDEWYAWEGMYTGTDTSYKINENGRIVTYQRSQIHDTDLHAQTAEAFIRRTAGGAPFFMYLSPNAPHKPAYSASRHANMFSSEPLP